MAINNPTHPSYISSGYISTGRSLVAFDVKSGNSVPVQYWCGVTACNYVWSWVLTHCPWVLVYAHFSSWVYGCWYVCQDFLFVFRIRLISLAAQKFISDIANDALQYCKMRGSTQSSRKSGRGVRVIGLHCFCFCFFTYHVLCRIEDSCWLWRTWHLLWVSVGSVSRSQASTISLYNQWCVSHYTHRHFSSL